MMLLILTYKGLATGKKKEFFLCESQELEEVQGYAKENLENSNEILTIRAIRKKYGLSLFVLLLGLFIFGLKKIIHMQK